MPPGSREAAAPDASAAEGGAAATVGTYLLNLVAESDACFGPSASSDARTAAGVGGSSALRFVPASTGDGGGTATAWLGGASSVMPGERTARRGMSPGAGANSKRAGPGQKIKLA